MRPAREDEALRTSPEGDPAPGLEGLPRAELEPLELAAPSFMDYAVRGPVVLTRQGRDAFVLLPLDVYRRLWAAAPRPPMIDGEADQGG
jgi:hypothetical protein